MPAVDIRKVPDDIRAAVAGESARRNMSANAVIVETLAARYGVTVDLSGYPHVPAGGVSDHWNIRIPETLDDLIRAHAREAGGTITGVVLYAIAARFGLPDFPIHSRRRTGADTRL